MTFQRIGVQVLPVGQSASDEQIWSSPAAQAGAPLAGAVAGTSHLMLLP
jgi:hypothetical protein